MADNGTIIIQVGDGDVSVSIHESELNLWQYNILLLVLDEILNDRQTRRVNEGHAADPTYKPVDDIVEVIRALRRLQDGE